MGHVIAAGAIFLGTHLGLSSTRARPLLAGALGERAYLGLYSLISLAALVYLVRAYNAASHAEFVWIPSAALRHVPFAVMPLALLLLLGGFMTRNPTAVGQEATAASLGEGGGVLRITRHPFQWSVVLWSVSHIAANGDVASLALFGSLGLVSLLGTFLLDRKKARTLPAWPAVAAVTSNLPFQAIAEGRNRFVLPELALPAVVALVAYAAIVAGGHRWLSGVSLF